MKKLSYILLFLGFISVNAQNVSDYKYIIVPQKFIDFEKDDFQLNSQLKIYLRKKNYEIISEGVTEKPNALRNNECLAVKANIENIKNSFKNKLKVTFTDCNDHIVGEYEGTSDIKEFNKGYQGALSFAMNKVTTQNAKEVPNKIQQKNKVISKDEPILVTISDNKIYSSDGKKYEAVNLSKGNFILMNKETAQIIAQFYPSSQKNIYHVTVISPKGNYQTIGFVSENEIIIEHQTSDTSWTNTFYTK